MTNSKKSIMSSF